MGLNLVQKLIEPRLVAGKAVAGEEIAVAVDQILLTDTNGTMAFEDEVAFGKYVMK